MAREHGSVMDGSFIATLETLDLYIHQVMNGRFGGMRRSRAYGSSAEFADYRDYVPGDDLRRIDWNLYGRLDKLFIRQYIDERQLETVIYLDASASMDADEEGVKARAAMQLSAAMGFLSVANMDRAAFRLIRGNRVQDLCGTIMGREGFYGAVQRLEEIDFEGTADLGEAIQSDPAPGYDNGMSIIVSDFLTDSDWKQAVDFLLSRKREVALLQVLSPAELEPLYTGPLALADAEAESASDRRNMRLRIDRGALRAYQQALAFFRKDMADFCASRGVPLVSVRSDERIEDAIIHKGFAAELIQ